MENFLNEFLLHDGLYSSERRLFCGFEYFFYRFQIVWVEDEADSLINLNSSLPLMSFEIFLLKLLLWDLVLLTRRNSIQTARAFRNVIEEASSWTEAVRMSQRPMACVSLSLMFWSDTLRKQFSTWKKLLWHLSFDEANLSISNWHESITYTSVSVFNWSDQDVKTKWVRIIRNFRLYLLTLVYVHRCSKSTELDATDSLLIGTNVWSIEGTAGHSTACKL